ncbi:MAG: TusE/DsrC/DsvC family sulfur relay protein [Granulosicoccus sp.]
MTYELDGKFVETTDAGFLVETADWNEELCAVIAKAEDIELTDKHWDVIKFLRQEYFENNGNQPMERAIKKAMEAVWSAKLTSKDLYDLFPGSPSKQGLKVAGLPATTRKGGY